MGTALSLVFLTVVRGTFPLFSRHLPLLQLFVGLMFFNTILYASFPMIVTYFSEWVMMGAKTLSVGSFAANHSMQLLLIMKLFGAAQCGQVQASLGVATAIGFGGGPVVGYYLHEMSKFNGGSDRESFNLFFYTCAGVSLLSAINVVFIGRSLGGVRENAKEIESQKPSESTCHLETDPP